MTTNVLLWAGLLCFGIFLADLAERIETWLRRKRDLDALCRRIRTLREGR